MAWLQDYGLVFDIAICLLLVTTIGYAIVLNRKFNELRSTRGEMQKMISEFAAATGKAEGGLLALKERSVDAGEGLGKKVDDACRLADEMAYLVKKGHEIADRLELSVAASRKLEREETRSAENLAKQPLHRAPMDITKMDRTASQGTAAGGVEAAKPVSGIAKLAKRKLSGSDSDLMRTLQAMR